MSLHGRNNNGLQDIIKFSISGMIIAQRLFS